MMQKYHAQFIGRTKSAIGIFYPIRAFTEGDTPKAAELALYDTYEHIQQLTLTPLVLRYVPTVIKRDGLRSLIGAAQGQHTHATAAEAQTWIDACLNPETNHPDMLRQLWGENPRPEVRPVWCWPGHFDPIGVYFD